MRTVCLIVWLSFLSSIYSAQGQGLRFPPSLFAADFSSDGKYLVVAGGDGSWVYSTEQGNVVDRRPGLDIRAAAFSPVDSSLFATWCNDHRLRLQRISQQEPVWDVKLDEGFIRDLQFFPGGKRLAVSCLVIDKATAIGDSGFLQIFDTAAGKDVKRFDFSDASVGTLNLSSDGQRLAAAKFLTRERSDIVIYRCDSWKVEDTIEMRDGFPNSVTFLNNNRDVFIAGGFYFGEDAKPRRDARIWRATRRPDNNYEVTKIHHEQVDSYRDAVVLPGGKQAIVCSTVHRESFKLDGKPGKPGAVPKARLTGSTLTPVFQLRDTSTGKLIWTVDIGEWEPYGLKLSPSGKQFVFCSQNIVYVASTETGEVQQEFVPESKVDQAGVPIP